MLNYPILIVFLFLSTLSFSQTEPNLMDLSDSLLNMNGDNMTKGTFKGSRVINGHSIETRGRGELDFIISHRFGTINEGIYEFFGLDQASVRFGLDYGIVDVLNIGLGRSSFNKTYDAFVKYKFLRQRSGSKNIPVSMVLFTSVAANTLRFNEDETSWRKENSRLGYSTQLLIAKKFSERFSLQITPTFIHRNFVERRIDQNNVFSVGVAGRLKLTKRVALSGEYFYLLPGQTATDYRNSASFGFDIETGGHVFQLHFTNAQAMIEPYFIPQTNASWGKKEIYFGFNISRVFNLID